MSCLESLSVSVEVYVTRIHPASYKVLLNFFAVDVMGTDSQKTLLGCTHPEQGQQPTMRGPRSGQHQQQQWRSTIWNDFVRQIHFSRAEFCFVQPKDYCHHSDDVVVYGVGLYLFVNKTHSTQIIVKYPAGSPPRYCVLLATREFEAGLYYNANTRSSSARLIIIANDRPSPLTLGRALQGSL